MHTYIYPQLLPRQLLPLSYIPLSSRPSSLLSPLLAQPTNLSSLLSNSHHLSSFSYLLSSPFSLHRHDGGNDFRGNVPTPYISAHNPSRMSPLTSPSRMSPLTLSYPLSSPLFPLYIDTMEAMILEEMSGAAHSYHDIVRGEAHELMVRISLTNLPYPN